MKIILEVVKSFFAANDKKYGSRKCLGVVARRQYTSFSCCASVLQMVAQFYGYKVSHMKAIKLTKCYPNGSSLAHVAKMLRREFGLKTKSLRTRAEIHSALQHGSPVITHDAVNYSSDHAILIVGETPKGVWIADSAVCEVYWRHDDKFMAAASEFIAVVGTR